MSNNNVSGIAQDHLGYMWYSTHMGLNKFDGYNFTKYFHNPKDSNSLTSDDITCLASGVEGMIWLGTSGKGLNGIDTYSGKIISYRHRQLNSLVQDSISCIFIDSTGIIWIGTASKGLDRFDPVSGKFKNYIYNAHDATSPGDDHITCIGSNGRGTLWVGTRFGGMNQFDSRNEQFKIFRHEEGISNSISSDDIRDIYVDTVKNLIWIATSNGLDQFDPSAQIFTIYLHDKDPSSISGNDITCVFKDKFNKIWAGTANDGVNVFVPATQSFLHYYHDPTQLNSLSSNKITSISQGRSGMMWIATSDGGLNAFNPQRLRFNLSYPFITKYDHNHSGCITALAQSSDQTIWIATHDDGITEWNPSKHINHTFRHDAKNVNSLCSNIITSTIADHNGIIWVGTDEGLNTIDPETQKISKIYFETGLNSGSVNKDSRTTVASNQKISALLESHSGIIWIGTEDGIFTLDSLKKSVVMAMRLEEITALAEDDQRIIWIGTKNGLKTLNPANGALKSYRYDQNYPYSISSNYINIVYCDSHGKIWVGTQDGGLNVFNRERNEFISYTQKDGLPGNSVSSILEDSRSNIWIGTASGICKDSFYDFALEQVRIYNEIDGLPTTEFEKTACLNSIDGRMYFSCSKGLILVNPNDLNPNTRRPDVVITDFWLFYKSIYPGDVSKILDTTISKTKYIRLSYDQRVFSFGFTAISFINPEKNKFKFKMEGYDKDWNTTDSKNRIATYTNLAPGNYVFRVLASNNDAKWNDVGTAIHISIASPYWKTWWFYLLCILLLSGILYGIYRNRITQLLKMQHVRNKIASDLHDDIGSTLTSITMLSQLGTARESNEKLVSLLHRIQGSSKQVTENMQDIVWAVNPSNDSMKVIIARMRSYAMETLGAREIQVHFDIDEGMCEAKLGLDLRHDFYLIFKEAVNNAAKYSLAKNVWITLTKNGKHLKMAIKDDGNGFDETIARQGDGLLNMKKRAENLHGNLIIYSIPNEGTTVELTL